MLPNNKNKFAKNKKFQYNIYRMKKGEKKHMDTYTAFQMGERYRGCRSRVFDWHKAARIIKETKTTEASAGLREDWTFTGGIIYQDGRPVKDSYTYLKSTWATPVLVYGDEDLVTECWCWEDECDWDEETKWPLTALVILKTGDN